LDEVFFSVIRSGIPNTQMPAWSVDFGGPLTDEDIRDTVALMRSWEDTAPEIKPAVFMADASRGAMLFANTCAVCHGEGGIGSADAPAINDLQRLANLSDDWYREVIRNGRPAKGMPTWGTVLSPNQIEDLIALIDTWRQGNQVQPGFDVTDLLNAAIFSLQHDDLESASLQIQRAIHVNSDLSAEALQQAAAQIASGDSDSALETLLPLLNPPTGDAAHGSELYLVHCLACHGAQGEGGIGTQLQPNAFVQSLADSELVDFLAIGRPGTIMAGFADRLTDQELVDIVAWLRDWQK
jgi:mono/diheme cytochrome c family protein